MSEIKAFPTKAAEYAANWRKKQRANWEQALGDIQYFVDLFERVIDEGVEILTRDSEQAIVMLIEKRLEEWLRHSQKK